MPAASALRVRMYNVGFGDCFLLTLPALDRPRHVLVDCGSHLSGQGPRPIGEVVERLIADVTTDGRARLDVVVASHRHFDHVSGFDHPAWRRVEVGEVWLPWTEDPRDPAARRIHDAQVRAALALEAALPAGPQALAVAEILGNALSNEGAMATLHHGFVGQPRRRFLPTLEAPTFVTSLLPGGHGARVGSVPRPARYPRHGSATYAELSRLGKRAPAEHGLLPFTSGTPATELEAQPEIKALRKSLAIERFELAVAIETAVNGTSLVLAFEVGNAVLLFAGDAQWGTWRVAMEEWSSLLGRTSFLKVGHHGSHNATPRDLVENYLPDNFWAMVSVAPVPRWPRVPKAELLARLAEKTPHLARSDRPDERAEGFEYDDEGLFVDALIGA